MKQRKTLLFLVSFNLFISLPLVQTSDTVEGGNSQRTSKYDECVKRREDELYCVDVDLTGQEETDPQISWKVRKLVLKRNNLNGKINDGLLKFFQDLEVLEILDNEIVEISDDAFYGLTHLRNLSLSVNWLQNYPGKPLSKLHNLKELNISYNRFQGAMTENWLFGTPNIETLDLSHNSFTYIFGSPFRVMPNLETLDLSSNQIVAIFSENLHGIPKLKKLNLNHNRLSIGLEETVFDNTPSIEHLSMMNSELPKLLYKTFLPLQHLKTLDITGNPFVCTCSVRWLWEELHGEIRIWDHDVNGLHVAKGDVNGGVNRELTCIGYMNVRKQIFELPNEFCSRGEWTEWGEWTDCGSFPCSIEYSMSRSRNCHIKRTTILKCRGQDSQTKPCFIQCEGQSVTTSMPEPTKIDSSENEEELLTTETTKAVVLGKTAQTIEPTAAQINNKSMPETTRSSIETISVQLTTFLIPQSSKTLLTKDELEKTTNKIFWSNWSLWSPCTKHCRQTRTRFCESSSGGIVKEPCEGESTDKRKCFRENCNRVNVLPQFGRLQGVGDDERDHLVHEKIRNALKVKSGHVDLTKAILIIACVMVVFHIVAYLWIYRYKLCCQNDAFNNIVLQNNHKNACDKSGEKQTFRKRITNSTRNFLRGKRTGWLFRTSGKDLPPMQTLIPIKKKETGGDSDKGFVHPDDGKFVKSRPKDFDGGILPPIPVSTYNIYQQRQENQEPSNHLPNSNHYHSIKDEDPYVNSKFLEHHLKIRENQRKQNLVESAPPIRRDLPDLPKGAQSPSEFRDKELPPTPEDYDYQYDYEEGLYYTKPNPYETKQTSVNMNNKGSQCNHPYELAVDNHQHAARQESSPCVVYQLHQQDIQSSNHYVSDYTKPNLYERLETQQQSQQLKEHAMDANYNESTNEHERNRTNLLKYAMKNNMGDAKISDKTAVSVENDNFYEMPSYSTQSSNYDNLKSDGHYEQLQQHGSDYVQGQNQNIEDDVLANTLTAEPTNKHLWDIAESSSKDNSTTTINSCTQENSSVERFNHAVTQ